MIDNLRLGKKLGVVHDPRTILAKTVIIADEVKVSKEHRIAHNLHQVPVFRNNEIGDCTQASKAHAVVCFENSARQREVQLSDYDVTVAYERIGGYVEGHPETDNGAYELDSLNDWRKNGIGVERDGTPHKIGAFVKVNPLDHNQVKRAHYLFGGLKVCAALPISAQDEVGDVWRATTDRPGGWGGHSMYSPGYGKDGIMVFTWGAQQAMTWEWWDKYVDEVYAVISEDYLSKKAKTPQGFDVDTLNAALASL